MNFNGGKHKMNDIKRGEIFYISRGGVSSSGSEQYADRPEIVVSNDDNNEHSRVIEVVYLTTQPKTELPTHVTIKSTGRISTALCEQVYSVSVDRVNNYVGQASEQEMKNIDIALAVSLAIGEDVKVSRIYRDERVKNLEEIKRLREKILSMSGGNSENGAINHKSAEDQKDILKLRRERDTYKALYEYLLERVTG